MSPGAHRYAAGGLRAGEQRGKSFAATTIPHADLQLGYIVLGASASADFDGDGDIDIAEAYGNPASLHLLRNDSSNQGGWLGVHLVGTRANRDGLGATVTINAGGQAQHRTLAGSSGSGGQSSHVLHFGLGTATTIDSVTVTWPGGQRQTLAGPLPGNQVLEITQAP